MTTSCAAAAALTAHGTARWNEPDEYAVADVRFIGRDGYTGCDRTEILGASHVRWRIRSVMLLFGQRTELLYYCSVTPQSVKCLNAYYQTSS